MSENDPSSERWPSPFVQAPSDSPAFDAYTRTSLRWVSSLFGFSPKAIAHKQRRLLSNSDSSPRSSLSDMESQSSTLLGSESHDEKSSQRQPSTSQSSPRVNARIISDAIIGLSDGLTVPFALTAGLSALGNTKVVIFAGLAELTAGAISMGLGGYLAAKSEEDSHRQTRDETARTVEQDPSDAAQAIKDVFEPYHLPTRLTDELSVHLSQNPAAVVQFLMHFQHSLPPSQEGTSRAVGCALTIACGYFFGGFLPLLPYCLVGDDQVSLALWWSFAVMAVSLFAFGYGKTCFVCGWRGRKNIWAGVIGGLQMLLVGSIAALSAMGLVRWFDSFAT